MENPDFLKKKYDLHNTPEVKKAAIRTEKQTGDKVPQAPADQIQNYLNRFKEIIERKDPADREMGMQALKKMLFEKFVTKFEEIPESWHALNERIIRERGQGGDWNTYTEEQKNTERRKQAEAVLTDQEASLEQWIDYLASEDSSYMPDYIKYWAFRSITDLAEYDKEKAEFPKRSKGTVKMFPDINQEALAYVIDAFIKKQKGEKFEFDQFEADLTEEQKESFRKNLTTENFAKLYGWANEQIHPIAKHLLPITEGKWIKYEQDDEDSENYKQLTNSIRGHGTGWCTAGENTARTQLEGGDFYCYYTLDDEGEPTIPRIAIRMQEGSIAEVRGIAYKQNLDPYMSEVLAEKLEEFPDKDQYLKKESDMKQLTELENKSKKGETLSKDDLLFLYEINDLIEGFGYERDPRIAELRAGRNAEEDMLIVFECTKEEIAHNPEEINQNTKAYVGALCEEIPGIQDIRPTMIDPRYKNIFQKLPETLEHVYSSFPDKKIRRENLEIGGKKAEQLISELEMDEINITPDAENMLKSPQFNPTEKAENMTLIRLSFEDLGFSEPQTIDQLYARAKELGLELCPAETGPEYRMKYKNQPMDEWVKIGMKPIITSGDNLCVFDIGHDSGGLWLGNVGVKSTFKWRTIYTFVFRLRKTTV